MAGSRFPLRFPFDLVKNGITGYTHLHVGSRHGLPQKYKTPVFWSLRLLLALVGGGLAVAYEVQQPLLAFHIGAASQALIREFAQGFLPPPLDNKPE